METQREVIQFLVRLLRGFDLYLIQTKTMRTLPLLTILLTFSLGTAQVQKNAELGVGAMGIVVSDIEASETFYKDLLGLTPIGGFSLDERWSQDAGAANNRPFSVKQF